jgi:hypothetical protein
MLSIKSGASSISLVWHKVAYINKRKQNEARKCDLISLHVCFTFCYNWPRPVRQHTTLSNTYKHRSSSILRGELDDDGFR